MSLNTKKSILNGFFMLGVSREGKTIRKEYCTDCPFCTKEKKLYIEPLKGLWQCKVCGEQGNYLKFLERSHTYAEQYITEEHLKELADNRKLPLEAVNSYRIGYIPAISSYVYPYFNYEGLFAGLRLHRLGYKPMNVSNTITHLFGAQLLKENSEEPVYITEGESDTFAMNYLLKINKKPGIAVGVPGAGSFKDEWIDLFYRREVTVLFDNDRAGIEGEAKIHSKLNGVATSLNYLHWPRDPIRFPDKYDVRDYIVKMLRLRRVKKALRRITSWLETVPRLVLGISEKDSNGNLVITDQFKNSKPATFQEIVSGFREYLYIPDTTPIKIMLAVMLSNRLRAERIWMFFVAPPSHTKTEFLDALSMCPETRHITTLTPQTLISGWGNQNGHDPSLLPLLNNKVLIIKDFTPILTTAQQIRDAIFSQLRDAYDGKTEKVFGHLVRSYKNIHFGVLAAVTGTIERTSFMQASLGERFLRYALPIDIEDLSNDSEEAIMAKCRKALSVTMYEKDLRQKVQILVRNYLQFHKSVPVKIPEKTGDKIIFLARWMATLRGIVDRDFKERMLYKPSKEGPPRLIKQLTLVLIGLASVENKSEPSEEDYNTLKKIAVSSVPSRMENLVRMLYFSKGPLKTRELIEKTQFDFKSFIPIIKDLKLLHVIKETQIGTTVLYELTNLMRFYIKKAELYVDQK